MSTSNNIKQKTVFRGVIVNSFLFVVKLILGIVGRSQALVADAFDTLSDMVGDIIILFGFRFSEKPPDEEHPYGHGKIESVVVGVVAMLIFITLGFIVFKAIKSIFHKITVEPSWLALLGALLSIITKEFLYLYLRKRAVEYSSPAIMASAAHAKSDMLSSIASSSGIAFAMLGIRAFDPITAIIISFMIARTALNLLKVSLSELTDRGLNPEKKEEILACIRDFPGVKGVHLLRSRVAGGKIELDVHLEFDPLISIDEAHSIAHNVKRNVMQRFPQIHEFLIHIEPEKTKNNLKETLENEIKEKIAGIKGIKSFRGVVIARSADGLLVCVDVEVDEDIDARTAHLLAHRVERMVKELVNCNEVHVHIDAGGDDGTR